MIISHWIIRKMRIVSDTVCKEYQNIHFVFNNFFSRNSCRLWDNVERYGNIIQVTYDNTAHARCTLYNWSYRHTLRICNIRTNCFSSAAMVTRTRLIVTFTRTLPVLSVFGLVCVFMFVVLMIWETDVNMGDSVVMCLRSLSDCSDFQFWFALWLISLLYSYPA
jgi:hypothetical protein